MLMIGVLLTCINGDNRMNNSLVDKARLKNIVDKLQQLILKRFYLRLYNILYRKNIFKLSIIFGTDKQGEHHYSKHYQRHFESLRRKKLNILEIGIGGYENPRNGGESLRMWKAFFPNSYIFGIDIYDKKYHDEKRIKTFKGSQVDEVFLREIAEEIGPIDIIIDDGSHFNDHVITTFKILFPLLSPNGIYVVEDLQTSYWDEVLGVSWGGSSSLKASHTSMNFFKLLVDGLNYEEFTINDYSATYFDKNIISMHFYHNLLFVYKGQNNEGSNVLGKRFS
jgi:demethylmacrocin O-methyltransferase